MLTFLSDFAEKNFSEVTKKKKFFKEDYFFNSNKYRLKIGRLFNRFMTFIRNSKI